MYEKSDSNSDQTDKECPEGTGHNALDEIINEWTRATHQTLSTTDVSAMGCEPGGCCEKKVNSNPSGPGDLHPMEFPSVYKTENGGGIPESVSPPEQSVAPQLVTGIACRGPGSLEPPKPVEPRGGTGPESKSNIGSGIPQIEVTLVGPPEPNLNLSLNIAPSQIAPELKRWDERHVTPAPKREFPPMPPPVENESHVTPAPKREFPPMPPPVENESHVTPAPKREFPPMPPSVENESHVTPAPKRELPPMPPSVENVSHPTLAPKRELPPHPPPVESQNHASPIRRLEFLSVPPSDDNKTASESKFPPGGEIEPARARDRQLKELLKQLRRGR